MIDVYLLACFTTLKKISKLLKFYDKILKDISLKGTLTKDKDTQTNKGNLHNTLTPALHGMAAVTP